MVDAFFRWLEDPINALVFFSCAFAVCWGGAVWLRGRRTQLWQQAGYSVATSPTGADVEAYPRRTYRRGPGVGQQRAAGAVAQGTAGEAQVQPALAALPALPAPAATPPNLSGALPFSGWWLIIGDSPIAVMIVGESQSGKSTTARALLAWRARTDKIVIIDPHEKFNDWGSLQPVVVGRDRNLDQAAAHFKVLHAEFERRFKRGEEAGPNLSIFIDEVPAIIAHAPEVADCLAQWMLEGAKAGFRVVFLAQDPGVEALGLKGRGKVRLSARKVLLGAFAAEVPGVLERPAAIEHVSRVKSIDASMLLRLSQEAANIDPAVAWVAPGASGAEPAEPVRDDDETALSAPSEPSSRTGSANLTLVRAGTDAVRAGSEGIDDDELITELVRRGVSANKIRELLGGTKAVVLEKVREAKGQAS